MSENSVLDFQDELFAKYDLAVEFAERTKRIETGLLACSADEDGAELVKRLQDGFTVCALELLGGPETPDVMPGGHMLGTGEPVFEYVYRVRYQGDPELWHLRPSCPPRFDDPLEGELRRGGVTLAFLAVSSDEAEDLFQQALLQVELILRAQSDEIEWFNQMLPVLIWQKLINHRTGFSAREANGTRH